MELKHEPRSDFVRVPSKLTLVSHPTNTQIICDRTALKSLPENQGSREPRALIDNKQVFNGFRAYSRYFTFVKPMFRQTGAPWAKSILPSVSSSTAEAGSFSHDRSTLCLRVSSVN